MLHNSNETGRLSNKCAIMLPIRVDKHTTLISSAVLLHFCGIGPFPRSTTAPWWLGSDGQNLPSNMMVSSNGNIFRVTSPLWGESFRHRRIPRNKGQWRRALVFSFICTRTNGWANNPYAGNLRRHHAHFDVTVLTVAISNPHCQQQQVH